MSDLFRSREMYLVQLFLQRDTAHNTLERLGRLGVVQFRDLNPDVNAFQRQFVDDVRRCDEMQRKLRFIQEQVATAELEAVPDSDHPRSLGELESLLEELEGTLLEMKRNQEALKREYYENIEFQHVLQNVSVFFDEGTDVTYQEHSAQRRADEARLAGYAPSDPASEEVVMVEGSVEEVHQPLIDLGDDDPIAAAEAGQSMYEAPAAAPGPHERQTRVGYLTGVLMSDQVTTFERILFRVTRGNMLLRTAPIDELVVDPATNQVLEKKVFIVFFHGQQARNKVAKICESFGANLYSYPHRHQVLRMKSQEVSSRLEDLRVVLNRSEELRHRTLLGIAGELKSWEAKLMQEKAIYHTLNMFSFDGAHQCLIGEGWCPQSAAPEIQRALQDAQAQTGEQMESILRVIDTDESPPTYFPTNKFTKGFQAIVDSYGTPGYREVNPGPFTIITFPFLFAVMFGDIGHGIILLLYALLLILYVEKKMDPSKLGEMIGMTYHGRYILLLMGIFSIYTGFLYNEMFSVPLNLFGSQWALPSGKTSGAAVPVIPKKTYPFGIDPMWGTYADNDLAYMNSLKMKLSVILGITQMLLGVMISLTNHLHFRKWKNIYCEFIPQLIFMVSIFGYLVLAIFIKWATDWNSAPNPPPSLIDMLIAMFLSPGSVPDDQLLYKGQAGWQTFLLLCAFISVPWMLFPKPFLLRKEHMRAAGQGYTPVGLLDADADSNHEDATSHLMEVAHPADNVEEFDFGEIMIGQVIHTIEFVLGGISHTASYLRLWALSLAHAELSKVFWTKIMAGSIETNNPVLVLVGFAVWLCATFFVLMGMESLSAFLHALRLHWIEFQSKFYAANGTKFEPFFFDTLGEESDD